jgi:hypothetical protein
MELLKPGASSGPCVRAVERVRAARAVELGVDALQRLELRAPVQHGAERQDQERWS